MKKLKNNINITVFILAFLLGILFNIQKGVFTSTREDLISMQYQQLVLDNEALNNEIAVYKDQLEKLQSSDEENDKTLSLIEHYKMLSGFTDVVGEGVIIQLSLQDLDQPLNLVDFHRNLLLLINELNAAGAEAISIKDERIISNSEIVVAGSQIVVNGQKLSVPFTIYAIGSPDTLEASLNLRQGYVDRLRNNGYFIEIKKSDRVEIPKYPLVPSFDYAEPKDES